MSVFGVILVRIFLHSDRIRWDTPYLSVFSPNTGKCRPEQLQIPTLFTLWIWLWISRTYFKFPSWRWFNPKISSSFTLWEDLLFCIPKGSVLEPVFFNIWTCERFLLFEDSNTPQYGDDTNLDYCQETLIDLKTEPKIDFPIVFRWLKNKYLSEKSNELKSACYENLQLGTRNWPQWSRLISLERDISRMKTNM